MPQETPWQLILFLMFMVGAGVGFPLLLIACTFHADQKKRESVKGCSFIEE